MRQVSLAIAVVLMTASAARADGWYFFSQIDAMCEDTHFSVQQILRQYSQVGWKPAVLQTRSSPETEGGARRSEAVDIRVFLPGSGYQVNTVYETKRFCEIMEGPPGRCHGGVC